jgi:hypothetical protein
MRPSPWIVAAVLAAAVCGAAAQDADESQEVAALLARIAARVEQYYGRAQSIICEETVRLQELGHDMTWDGSHVRQLVYELRVSWDASTDSGKVPEASVLRQLISVDGRPPNPRDEPGCMDPKPVSPEPLGMFLPTHRHEYAFKWAGSKHSRDRSTVTLDYKSTSSQPPEVRWKDECVSVDLPGRWRGRAWVDAGTGDVQRLDEQLVGFFEFPVPKSHLRRGVPSRSMTIERAESSTRYRPVVFTDPDETVMLPESIVSLQVIRDSGVPRLRTQQTFSKYRRFVTDGRIVRDPGSR